MFKDIIKFALIAIGAIGSLNVAAAGQTGENWPSRPIRLVAPSAPGMGSDIVARLLGNELSKALGQPVVIDNKPGGSGVIAGNAVAKSSPDGYNVLFSGASFTVMPEALGQGAKRPFDLMKDLVPVAQIGQGGVLLVASNDFPASNLKEMVKLVKTNPDKYQYAAFGIGTAGHLTMEWLKNRENLQIGFVPYKSTVQIITDLQANVLKLAWVDITSSVPAIQSGNIKVLSYNGVEIPPNTPKYVKTMTEEGYSFNTDGWYGLFLPAGTPKSIIERLNVETNKAMNSPELKQILINLNLPNAPIKTPEQFSNTMKSDIKVWSEIVRENKIKLEN